MRIRIRKIEGGLHPRETVIAIATIHGDQAVVLDERSIKDDTIEVGHPIAEHENYYLVELPAETTTGAWRVWIDKAHALEELEAAE